MSLKKRARKTNELQKPEIGEEIGINREPRSADHERSGKSLSIQSDDLRSLIKSRKESEKQLNIRYSLLQSIIEGSDAAIFSVDKNYCYTNFNKKHTRDMEEIYGVKITAGRNLTAIFCVEKDRKKIASIIGQALLGNAIVDGDYFGDHTRSRRFFEISCYPTGMMRGSSTVPP
jgi:hypothetical protein